MAKTKMNADDLLEQFKDMTLLELADFVKKFEETFDVQAAVAAPVMAAPGAGGAVGSVWGATRRRIDRSVPSKPLRNGSRIRRTGRAMVFPS